MKETKKGNATTVESQQTNDEQYLAGLPIDGHFYAPKIPWPIKSASGSTSMMVNLGRLYKMLWRLPSMRRFLPTQNEMMKRKDELHTWSFKNLIGKNDLGDDSAALTLWDITTLHSKDIDKVKADVVDCIIRMRLTAAGQKEVDDKVAIPANAISEAQKDYEATSDPRFGIIGEDGVLRTPESQKRYE